MSRRPVRLCADTSSPCGGSGLVRDTLWLVSRRYPWPIRGRWTDFHGAVDLGGGGGSAGPAPQLPAGPAGPARPAAPGTRRPPAYRALADGIRLLVLEGRVPVGARLPAERELALALS